MDVVNPVEMVVYNAAKRLGGPDLISAVVTLQQPLLCVCVRGDYCRISVSAYANAVTTYFSRRWWMVVTPIFLYVVSECLQAT